MAVTKRTRILLSSATALATVIAVANLSGASTPPDSTLTAATTSGKTTMVKWTGTIPTGSNPTSACATPGTTDSHTVRVVVPRRAKALTLKLTFAISWTPAVAEQAADQVLSVIGPDGHDVGDSDGGSTTETVALENPGPGVYTAIACGFVNPAPTSYVGKATMVTADRVEAPPVTGGVSVTPGLPVTPSGLSFGAAVPSDPQRNEGEPAVTVDPAGRIYSCGPSGFSNVADYAQVSTDGGDQFHLLGEAPRGQISLGEGGGDCALATSPVKNSKGDYTLAYAGLGPLTNFSTASSLDGGKTFTASPISESFPGVDRQWLAFADAKTVFFNYNSTAVPSQGDPQTGGGPTVGGQVVQKSVDGGLTYDTPGVVASTDGGRIGQIRAFTPKGKTADNAVVYFPYDNGNKVKLAISVNGGRSYSQCEVARAEAPPTAGFVVADNDDYGNIYVTWAEKGGGRDTYFSALHSSRLNACAGNRNPGWTKPVRLNRAGIETTVMPWIAAGGEPGHVAVAYYGTKSIGDPDSGTFKATWNVYVDQTLNAFAKTPTVDQVKVTTHPFHYDSICLNGLGCTIAGGDRSLVDYFTMAFDKPLKKLTLVFSQTGKRPDDHGGYVSTPMVATQNAGPSNGGGMVKPGRPVVRSSSADPAGDAISRYSSLAGVTGTALGRGNVAAADFVGQRAVDVATAPDGGLTVRLHLADLSTASLASALATTTSGSLEWIFRFSNGYQMSSADAFWSPAGGFSFGFDDYTVSAHVSASGTAADGLAPLGRHLSYPGAKAMTGAANQGTGIITLNIPKTYLRGLVGSDGPGMRPKEVPAGPGTRFYDATAFSFLSPEPIKDPQFYMYQADNAPSMDFYLGKP